MANVDGQTVEIQEVCADDGHENVRHDELPGVAFWAIVHGHLLVSIGWDGGPIGSLHREVGSPVMTFDEAARDERAGSTSIDEILYFRLGICQAEGRRGGAG